MAAMNEEERRGQAERLRLYLDELRERMDPPAHRLLLKVLRGLGTALTSGGGDAQIAMDPEERMLFTDEFQRELRVVMGLLNFSQDRVLIDTGGDEGADEGEDEHLDQRELDRREVESIARASGMAP